MSVESQAAELTAKGIPANKIAIFANRMRDLPVPAADGAKAPRNRPVEIVYEGGPTS